MGTRTHTTLAAIGLLAAASCAEWRHWPPGARTEPTLEDAPTESEVGQIDGVPLQLERAHVLGKVIEDPSGFLAGTLEDLVLDPATGGVVAVIVAVKGADGDIRREALDLGAIQWQEGESGLRATVIPGNAHELSPERNTDPFDGRELARVEGEIMDVRTFPTTSAVLKVRDDDNLLHRVRVAAPLLVMRNGIALEPGQAVEVEGVQTRDDRGKLWIACSLTQGDTTLALRDATGRIQWEIVASAFLFASRLVDMAIIASDGTTLRIEGWRLAWSENAVVAVIVTFNGEARAIPWNAIEREGTTWSLRRSPDEFSPIGTSE